MLDQVEHAVGPVRDGAVQFARNLGGTVRENPIPAAMVGIGLGWLLLSGRRGESAWDSGHASAQVDRIDPSRPANDPIAGSTTDKSASRAREARDAARERGERVRNSVSEAADTTYRRVSDKSHRAGAQISDRAAEVGNFVQRRPIATGLAVAGIGAVIAAALLARTDRGKAVVARASEAMKDGSNRMSEAVRSTAEDVSEAAAEAASKAGDRLDEAVEKIKGGADKAREAARDKLRGTEEKDAKPAFTGAGAAQPTSERDTRSMADQVNADRAPGEPDALKPVAVKPVPVSPPPFGDDVPQVGAGEIHDTGSGSSDVRPGSKPGTTTDSTPVPPSARKL
jgi:gas vesicle protein